MLDILNTTKQRFTLDKKLLFKIKNEILGNNYELSLVIIADKKSQTLNKKFRKKDKPTNVLSFPLDDESGEIFLNVKRSSLEAKNFKMKTREFLYYLLIHGILHLKGFDHGEEMEKEEEKLMSKFKIS